MNPTGNLQGSYRFLSLATGKCIRRRKWTELPITDEVIARVHELARAEKSFDPAPNFFFEWAPNMPVANLPAEHQEQPPLPVLRGANNPDGNNNDDEEVEENEEEEDTIYEDEGAPGAPGKDEGAPGAPPHNEEQVKNEEQEAQEAVDEAPHQHHQDTTTT